MSSRILRPQPGEQAATALNGCAPIDWRPVNEAAGSPRTRVRQQRLQGQAGAQGEPAVRDIEQQGQELVAQARQQARAEGEAAGAQRAALDLEPVIARWQQMVEELAGLRRKARAEAEEDTVKLAVAIARRVLRRELAADPEALLGIVKAAFGKLNSRETRRLRVCPTDAVLLEAQRHLLDLPPGLEILRDVTLSAGSAIFETSRGELDASVDTQLLEIERGLTDVLSRKAQ